VIAVITFSEISNRQLTNMWGKSGISTLYTSSGQ